MTKFRNKCDTYKGLVKDNLNLIERFRIIALVPTILSTILGFFLSLVIYFITYSPYAWLCILLILFGIIYYFAIVKYINEKFQKTNAKIIDSFIEYYQPDLKRFLFACIISDNKNVSAVVNRKGANSLRVYIKENALRFISASFFNLKSLTIRDSDIENRFLDIVARDFGELIIPIDDIDNYRDKQLMVAFRDDVLKINFEDNKFMDVLIPTKDLYFNINKK